MFDDEEIDDNDQKNSVEIENQSDINDDDTFNDEDYYNDNIKEYKEAEPLPSVEPPKETNFSTRKPYDYRPNRNIKETFMNFDEKFQKIKNEDYNEDEFYMASPEEICENYKTTFNVNIDISSNNYDIFSKNHLRNTLIEQIKKIDWINQGVRIEEAKKETNAYEEIYEKYFYKNQSCQLANINYLFDKKLIAFDNFFNGIPVFIVGDNGGFTDWIMYYTIEKMGYSPTIFVIPERTNEIKKTKFREQIKEKVNEHVEILDEFYQENKDFDENSKLSNDFLNNIVKTISDKTDGYKVNLYIARKVIKFSPDSSQEIRYKKFLLVNTLLAFKLLNNGGHFIIKLYDTFTPFTIGIIYMIFKNFENVSIFKPVSTRQYSPCRFLVAENYQKNKDDETSNSIKYLEDFLTKYIEFTNNNYDVKIFLPSSELRKNEHFLKIIPEINNGITEKRIDALKEIINYLDKKSTNLYDKMSIKKFFLNRWGIPVINYDESKLLKNREFNYNNYSKKKYTDEEKAEAYKNVGNLDDDQIKMIKLMQNCNKKHKNKNKEDKSKHREQYDNYADELERKYRIADEIMKKKKTNNRKKKDEKDKIMDKYNNIRDNKDDYDGKKESVKKEKKIIKIIDNKDSGKKNEKEFLKKKKERSEDKKEHKNDEKKDEKKKNEKKEEKEEKELDISQELSQIDEELGEKLAKLSKFKVKKNKKHN